MASQVILIKKRIPGTGAPASGIGVTQVRAGELATSISAVAATGIANLYIGDGSFVHDLVSAARQVELDGVQTIIGAKTIGAAGSLTSPLANFHIQGGTNGYLLSTNGTGTLSWIAPPSAVIVSATAPPVAGLTAGDMWFDSTNEVLHVWDGTNWMAASGGGIGEPTTAGSFLRTNTGTWVAGLPLAGGTLTGALTVDTPINPGIRLLRGGSSRMTLDTAVSGVTFSLNTSSVNTNAITDVSTTTGTSIALRTDSTLMCRVSGGSSPNPRWDIVLKDSAAGENFAIRRWDNAGVLVDSPLAINRATGAVTIPNLVNSQFLPLTGGTLTGALTVGTTSATAISVLWNGATARGVEIVASGVGQCGLFMRNWTGVSNDLARFCAQDQSPRLTIDTVGHLALQQSTGTDTPGIDISQWAIVTQPYLRMRKQLGATALEMKADGTLQIGETTGPAVTGHGNINIEGRYYVNGVSIGTGPFLPLAGGTLTGLLTTTSNITVNDAGGITTSQVQSTGNLTLTAPTGSNVLLPHAPTVDLAAATKKYVDDAVASVDGGTF